MFASAYRPPLVRPYCYPESLRPIDSSVKEIEAALRLIARELSPLGVGLHALVAVPTEAGGRGKRGGLREYARRIGKPQSNVTTYRQAAVVLSAVETDTSMYQFLDKAQHLAAIHAAAREDWPLLVAALIEKGWPAYRPPAPG